MINSLVKYFLSKELVIFNPHRNSDALLNEENRKNYVFFDPKLIWRFTFIFGRNSKLRYQVFAAFLNFLKPIAIIDINWITHLHTLYFVWCKKKNSLFIVIQHGAYVAGVVTDKPHRIIKCNVFLVWSHYWKQMFEVLNEGKKFKCIVFGNPIYNIVNRSELLYNDKPGLKVLIAPTVLEGERYKKYHDLLDKLLNMGFEVYVKEHKYQSRLYMSIEAEHKVDKNFLEIMQSQDFDLVITDISTAMLDIIYYKNRVIYYSPPGNLDAYTENVYSQFLNNLIFDIDSINCAEDIFNYVDIESQEKLLDFLVQRGNNKLLSWN